MSVPWNALTELIDFLLGFQGTATSLALAAGFAYPPWFDVKRGANEVQKRPLLKQSFFAFSEQFDRVLECGGRHAFVDGAVEAEERSHRAGAQAVGVSEPATIPLNALTLWAGLAGQSIFWSTKSC
jgi:hypothetical protein